MKKSNQKWNRYLSKKTIRPKTFTVTLERDRNGKFKLVGKGTSMLKVVNQHQAEWVSVDVRDFAAVLGNSQVEVS